MRVPAGALCKPVAKKVGLQVGMLVSMISKAAFDFVCTP